MPDGATTQECTVAWNTGDMAERVSECSMNKGITPVDCSALADELQDNRAGRKTIAATLTVLLKDSYSSSMEEGDVGALAIDGIGGTVLITNVESGGGGDAPRTLRFSFVSTLKTVGT